jgi:hypothetical protein
VPQIERLNDRYLAQLRGNLALYDQAFTSGCLYIPGTDIPLHPAAVAFTPWWRITTIAFLVLFFIFSLPNWKMPVYAWGPFCVLFHRDISP